MTPPVAQPTFGERLKAARLEARLTNLELARAAEVSERDIYRWQSGETEPRWRMVMRLARILDKPVEYFDGHPE